MIEGHGDDIYRYAGGIVHNFSSNICSAGVDHSGLMACIASAAGEIAVYPEPEPYTLERRICRDEGLPEGSVLVANGAVEAIYLIAGSRHGARSAIIEPTFSEYRDACRLHAHSILPSDNPMEALTTHPDILWLCNPNNPTGTVTDPDRLRRLMGEHPATLFVIDQAYADYTDAPRLTPADTRAHPNLIILRSMTKRFAVPGLRVGYAIGSPAAIDAVRRCRMPWSVGVPAIIGAGYLLDHKDDYVIPRRQLHDEILRIARALAPAGITASDTRTNFALFRLPGRLTAAGLKEHLAREHGILIRDASNFHGLTPGHFRLAAQSAEANDLIIRAISKYLNLTDSKC